MNKLKNIVFAISAIIAIVLSFKNCDLSSDLIDAKNQLCNIESDTTYLSEIQYDTIHHYHEIEKPVQIITKDTITITDSSALALIDLLQKQIDELLGQLENSESIKIEELTYNYKDTFQNEKSKLLVDVKAKGAIESFDYDLKVFEQKEKEIITIHEGFSNNRWELGLSAGSAFIDDNFRPSFGVDLSKGWLGGRVGYVAPLTDEKAIVLTEIRLNVKF